MLKAVPTALTKLLPKSATEILSNRPRNLYETLSRLPNDGVGSHVFQTRWQSKGIRGCYWEISRVKLKLNATHGKAWGKLTWRGAPVSTHEEEIRGGLKYMWSEGISKGHQPLLSPRASEIPKTAEAVHTSNRSTTADSPSIL